jgi:hypothetical protein
MQNVTRFNTVLAAYMKNANKIYFSGSYCRESDGSVVASYLVYGLGAREHVQCCLLGADEARRQVDVRGVVLCVCGPGRLSQ